VTSKILLLRLGGSGTCEFLSKKSILSKQFWKFMDLGFNGNKILSTIPESGIGSLLLP